MWPKHRRKVPICSIGKGGKTREGIDALLTKRPIPKRKSITRVGQQLILKQALWPSHKTDVNDPGYVKTQLRIEFGLLQLILERFNLLRNL
jgi:hypothetical protein